MSDQPPEVHRLTGDFDPRPAGTPEEEAERRRKLDERIAELASQADDDAGEGPGDASD